MPLTFQGGTMVPAVGTEAYKVAASPNQTGAGSFNASTNELKAGGKTVYSPSVISDANVHETAIPNIQSTTSNLLNTSGSANQSNTENQPTTETTPNSYEDIYNRVLGEQNAQPQSPEVTEVLNSYKDLIARSDAASAAQIGAMQSAFNSQVNLLQGQNDAETAALRHALAAQGFTPQSTAGALNIAHTVALSQLQDLTSKEAVTEANLRNAALNSDIQLQDKYNTLLQNIRTEKLNTAKDMADKIQAENQKIIDAKQKIRDNIASIALDAAKNGAPKEIQDAIRASGDESSAIAAAGSYLQTATGTLGDYLQYKKDAIASGHNPVDFETYKQAEETRKNKAAQELKATPSGAAAPLPTGGSSTGSIQGDMKDILEGRNTMYNIRQTMGRTNQAAAYMQSLRDEIRKIDPNFDFVASDAGGKSVSTAYVQRATAAINSVLPNIDKVVDLSNQVLRIGVKGVDNLLQKGAIQIGDQKVSNFREAQRLIADEIGVALGAGTVSDMKLQLGFDVTDPSVTPEVFASNMGIVKDFVNNRLKGLQELRYRSTAVGQSESDFEKLNTEYGDAHPEARPTIIKMQNDGRTMAEINAWINQQQ